MFRVHRFVVVLLMAGVCLMPRAARAQAGRGRLLVTVTDVTGAVLPNADVRVTGLENATRAVVVPPVKANEQGLATLTGLAPGRYAIEAEFPGFERATVREFRVRAGDNRQTLVLPLRGLNDSVTVGRDQQEAAADRGVTFGTALTREQIDALSDDPNELRQQLLDMAGPGAVISVDSFEGGQLPNKAQIRSIRIARDQFAAENHGAGIGRIEIITQPGIGPLRGGVGTNFYDSSLDGRNPLVASRPPSRNQSMNASVGGTILKEKVSFSAGFSSGRNTQTPVLVTSTDAGPLYSSSGLKASSDNTQFFSSVDYALTRDQTLRFNVNRYGFSSANQGVGTFNQLERAYSNDNTTTSIYVQQTGPLGRRLALNSRLSFSWNDSASRSVLEERTIVVNEWSTTGGAQQTGGTHSRSLSLASDLDYVRGIHSVRVGVLADLYRYRSDSNSNYLGTYTFESIEAFRANRPRSYTQRIGDPNVRYTNAQVGLYVQDDIRVRKNLTLSPGLRYEVQTHLTDRVNVGPRFGFTWAPFASGRTTIRSSVGVFYDWLNTGTYQQTLVVDGFRQQEVNLLNPGYPDPGALPAAPPTNRYLLGPDLQMPRTFRLSLGFAHTFNPKYSVGAVYSDSRGSSQFVGRNLNAPVGGLRPDLQFANVIEATSAGRSRQRTLNSNVSINLAGNQPVLPTGGPLFQWRRGLRLSANHTLGDNDNDTDGPFAVPATNDLASEWGPAAFDVRHRVGVSAGSIAIRGLSAQISLNWNSAPPLTIRTGTDDNADLIFNDRPAGVGRNSGRTASQFNSSAFFSYAIPLGSRMVSSGGGVSITSSGGGLVINQVGAQSIPRYRLNIGVNIQNLTNRANYSGYSGVINSPNFMKPLVVQGVRRVNFNIGLSF